MVTAVALPLVVFSRQIGLSQDVADGLMGGVVTLVFPATFGIALLRSRLFDIDLVLRRSAVFVALWLAIGATAAALAGVVGAGDRLPAVVLLAAGASGLAVVVDPARRRVERAVDRWVFGQAQDPYAVVAGFSARLGTTGPEALGTELARSVRTGFGVDWARVTLNNGVTVGDGGPQDAASLTQPIAHDGARLGVIECGPKTDGVFSDRDLELLATLARQTALALNNVLLAARIVHAQEAERRRIERNLHDGVQQRLVALVAGLGLAREQATTGLDRLPLTLERLYADALLLQHDLRDLAKGIHPSVLTDGGLAEAVAERCARLPVPVRVDAEGVRTQRYADEIEGAAYFVVMEAVANALKHAEPGCLRVRLTATDGQLSVIVTDDGKGFDITSTVPRGLAALADRAAALGGYLSVTSTPGAGTTVTAILPATPTGRAIEAQP